MAQASISAIHPEYLRPLPNPPEARALWGLEKKMPFVLLGTGVLVLIMGIRMELALSDLRAEAALLREHTTKVFSEYDALHHVIVERLKRHGEMLKTLRGEKSPGEPRYGQVTVPRANVRAQSTASSAILMTVPEGGRLLIEEDLGEWLKVMTPLGTSGYIAREVFKETP